MRKLWVDDERHPPDDTWRWATNSADAVHWLQDSAIDEVSLDHDLGGFDTARPIVLWMCTEEAWPKVIRVHSRNPVGAHWLAAMCSRYAPDKTVVFCQPFVPPAMP